ncbi:Zinc finger bed domain-containing protein 1-like protein [Globisporangium polare]
MDDTSGVSAHDGAVDDDPATSALYNDSDEHEAVSTAIGGDGEDAGPIDVDEDDGVVVVDAQAAVAHDDVSAGDVADMALEIEGEDMKSHMELLRNGGMMLDAAAAAAAVAAAAASSTESEDAGDPSGGTSGIDATVVDGTIDGSGGVGDGSLRAMMESAAFASAATINASATAAATTTTTTVSSSSSRGGGRARSANGSSPSSAASVSAVYRWYDIEDGFHLKRKEESSIAKCKLCRQQGKLERKTCVRFSKSVTSNLWRHLKENHPEVYSKHAGEKKSVQMHTLVGAKKRGRKKKVTTEAAASSAGGNLTELAEEESHDSLLENHEAVHSKLLDHHHEAEDNNTHSDDVSALQRSSKKQKRSDQFFHEYQLTMAANENAVHQQRPQQQQGVLAGRQPGQKRASVAAMAAGNFNPEKVREAMGYLCLYEMLPFDVCSSHAFRNLMLECSGGSGGYLNEANSFAIFGKEIAFGYAKKLAAEVKVRVLMQMKMTDFAHLMISEWKPSKSSSDALSSTGSQVGPGEHVSDSSSSGGDGSAMRFLALFAVGLDQEFNAFRRCLHVLPVEDHQGSTTAELINDEEMKKAVERVMPCKYMPQILAIDPPSDNYHSLCSTNKLDFLESVSSLLQNVMLATINGVNITETFSLGGSILTTHLGLIDRRLDGGEFIESSASAADDFYELPEAEVPSAILEELPSKLTGHTLRDLILKVMYLLAHLKQSRKSRKVLQKIALEELDMDREVYERVFVTSLRETQVSFGRVAPVLSLIFEMMPTLQRYFAIHREGLSDFSKLVQLAALSQYEWSRIAYLKTILKPFADATIQLEAERFVVSSMIIPSIITLLEKLRDTRPSRIAGLSPSKKDDADAVEELPEDIVALKDLAYANLSASFGYLFLTPESDWSSQKHHTFNILWSATLLDPRTRPFIIKGALPQLEFWEIVKVEAANVAGTKMKDKDSNNELSENAISLDDENAQLDSNSKNLWDDLQANLASCAQEEMLLSSSKSSLEMAKSTNLLEVEVSFFQEEGRISLSANPLEWWQNMRIKYPFLARLARFVLSIPFNVKTDDNPVLADNGFVGRAQSEMSLPDLCEFLAASMNLRTEKNSLFEASNKPMWSTV